ncbi:MAG: UDP-N-acetylmuramoyl-tripeptide--D-alanyl-D-alanine ligase [Sandaracinaceae bacterium]|nr:UDP-N-acetylmuramoyl-tripeptide--D-alanyl-D-alanine ligase [Sandaracinaceae bacterium]
MATPIPQNQVSFDLGEVAFATKGHLVGPRELRTVGVSTDSRTLKEGALFVALVGRKHDGHAHLEEAFTKGARAALISSADAAELLRSRGLPFVRVGCTLEALGQLAAFHRERLEKEGRLRWVIAISGAIGKTTTKEMSARVLEALGIHTLRSPGNLNNRVGLPMSVFLLTAAHEAAVLELGSNQPGEISKLASTLSPHVAIVTALGATHTEALGSIEGVAEEEGSLFRFVRNGPFSALIYGGDEPLLRPQVAASASSHFRVGHEPAHEVCFRELGLGSDGRFHCEYRFSKAQSPPLRLRLAMLGRAASFNGGLALALALHVGGVEAIQRAGLALEAMEALPGRGRSIKGPKGALLVDDSYNASRPSIENALNACSELARARKGRLVVVLGDVLELGPCEEGEHRLIGEAVARSGAARFFAIGERMQVAAQIVRHLGATQVFEAKDVEEIKRELVDFLEPKDVVLIKGSRGMRMERLIPLLVEHDRASNSTHAHEVDP